MVSGLSIQRSDYEDKGTGMARLIGFTGAAGAGKDTAGMILAEQYGYHLFAFADPLYDALIAMTQYSEDRFRDRHLKEVEIPSLGVSPRKLLQTLGTEWGRDTIDKDWWVKLARSRVRQRMQCGYDVVVTDVRFQNEVDMVREFEGTLIRIEREGTAAVRPHVSENPAIWEQADRTILNDGTITALDETLQALIEDL